MKRIRILWLLVCIVALISSCASTAKFKDEPPSPGTAFVCLPVNLWVDHVDGKRLYWNQRTRHEIAAGQHELTVGYNMNTYYGYDRATGIKITGMFEEGKSYYIFPNVLDRKIHLNLVENSESQKQIVLTQKSIFAVAFISYSPDGSELLASHKKAVNIYDANDGTLKKTLEHSSDITVAIWSPDGTKIISTEKNGMIKIWDTESGNLIKSINANKGYIIIEISPDGTKLLGNSGNDLKIWDINSGAELVSVEKLYKFFGVSSFAFSPDGQYFAATFADETTRVYSINGGAPIFSISDKKIKYLVTEFVDNNTLIAVMYRGLLSEPKDASIDISSNKVTELKSEYIPKRNYSFDNNKTVSVITFDGGGGDTYTFLHVKDIKSGKIEKSFTTPQVDIVDIDVSPVKNELITFSSDGKIRFWDF